MNDYPDEIREGPRPVVLFMGCNTLHPHISKNITTKKEVLARTTGVSPNESSELPSLHIISVELSQPGNAIEGLQERRKERRTSYEVYVPAGIFKCEWMHKHKTLVPSVVCMFFIWEAEDKNLKAKENEIVAALEHLKKNMKSRNNKLLVVLVVSQKASQDPAATANSEEKLSSLKKRADIDSKSIFTFDKDNIAESSKRLEKSVHELSRQYYKEEAKKIKKDYQKGQLNRYTQLILTVRHSFKIAYFAEFRKDNRTTLKYYNLAYNSLREMAAMESKKPTSDKMPEIKTVADYINFQICKLYLLLPTPNYVDSVNQFQKHVKGYKSMIGVKELQFEHWAWVARQYQVFGQLLELLAPQTMDTKVSIQNPGFYYHAAANYQIDRKQWARSAVQALKDPSALDKYKNIDVYKPASIDLATQQYIGQLPPEVSHPLEAVNDQPKHDPEVNAETLKLKSIAREQFTVNHSQDIIQLLLKSLEHYSDQKTSRQVIYTQAQLADEYFDSKDYDSAKGHYDQLMPVYRREGWFELLKSAEMNALECAKQLDMAKDYLKYALEIIAPYSLHILEEKQKVQRNLIAVLNDPASLGLKASTSPLVVAIPYNHPLIPLRVQFTESCVYAKSPLVFKVKMKATFPLPVTFNSVSIEFSDPAYNTTIHKIPGSQDEGEGLLFAPEKAEIFSFDFVSKEKMELRCSRIRVELGKSPSSVVFQWEVNGWPPYFVPLDGINTFLERTSTQILAHKANLDISLHHAPPALVGEYYVLEVHVKNHGEPIIRGTISLDITKPTNALDDKKHFYLTPNLSQPVHEFPLDAVVETGAEYIKKIYFHCDVAGTKKVVAKVSYSTEMYNSWKSTELDVTVQYPFAPQFSFSTQQFQPILPSSGDIIVNQPCFMYIDIQSTPPYQLKLEKLELLLNQNENGPVATSVGSTAGTNPHVLLKENQHTIWYQLIPTISGDDVLLGNIVLHWKRVPNDSSLGGEGQDGANVQTIIPVPPVKINTAPFTVQLDVPSFAVLGTPTLYSILIHNHTDTLQTLAMKVIDHTSFLFAGPKVCNSFGIHPHSDYTLRYMLVPLSAGRHALPSIQLTSKRFNRELPQTKQTRYIFINPSKEPTRHIK